MKKSILAIFFLFCFSAVSFPQLTQRWVATYNWTSTSNDGGSSVKVKNGFVYVVGWGIFLPDSGYSVRTIKYDTAGSVQWTARYQSSNSITPAGIDIDGSGNVFVLATKNNGTNNDYFTIKYNSSGVPQWTQQFNAGGNDEAGAIGVDDNGNIYVTGGSDTTRSTGRTSTTLSDIVTIAYNTSGGIIWQRRFVSPFFGKNGNDKAWSLAIDNNSGHLGEGVYVAGWYHNGHNCTNPGGTNCYHDAQVVHYKFDGGYKNRYVDEVHYGCGDSAGEDYANAITISSNTGNIYCTGAKWCNHHDPGSSDTLHGHDLFTFKSFWRTFTDGDVTYDSLILDEEYCDTARYYYSNGGENIGTSVLVDVNDCVYATGYSQNRDGSHNPTDYDCVTIKYDSNGIQLHVARYNSGGSSFESGASITKCQNKIFVTGTTGSPGSDDLITLKYDTTLSMECMDTYNGSSNAGDIGYSIANDGNYAYVTGVTNETNNFGNQSDIITIKYLACASNDDSKRMTRMRKPGDPETFYLGSNYPNPFNPSTVIKYAIPVEAFVTLKIYNILGQTVLDIPSKFVEPGYYSETINASALSSGVYFYRIYVRDSKNSSLVFSDAKKMLLIK